MANTFSLKEIVGAQQKIWFILLQPLAFIIYYSVELLKPTVYRPSVEAESELTADSNNEYGMGFSRRIYQHVHRASVAPALLGVSWHRTKLHGEYLGIVWFFS
ncbi:MAG: hypothetical protein SRB2_03018 [Desulfobacteraceae bacterium Eth-SRB2]|nr:MAG: hypothetical protein SRB2_03018 [Desulfobacteraceae bacterium Eth-SRB2]